ncbi:MAG: redoxin domain-containing protein [Chloroflexi bacterium]|nr:redoxin domain-containing protein [Chloroflexota bacterium]
MSLLFPALVVSLLSAVAALWLGYQMLRQYGRLLHRVDALEQRVRGPAPSTAAAETQDAASGLAGLPVGSVLNDFELPRLAGGAFALSSALGRRLLLLFVQPSCPGSREVVAALASAMRGAVARDCEVYLVSSGATDAQTELARIGAPVGPLLLQEGRELADLYRVSGTPSALLVDQSRRTAAPLAIGGEAILRLVQEASVARLTATLSARAAEVMMLQATPRPGRTGLPVGSLAPRFKLPLLNGGSLGLASFRGQRTMIVFSDPSCPPCRPLLSFLQQVHAARSAPRILVVSRGELEMNARLVADMGLTLPVVRQENREVMRDYEVVGTPVAFLIDERGRTVGSAAFGAESIRALAESAAALGEPVP